MTEIPALIEKKKVMWSLWGRLWRGDIIRDSASRCSDFAAKNHITWCEDVLLFYFIVKEAAAYSALSDVGYRYFRSHGGITSQNSAAMERKKKSDREAVLKIIRDDRGDEAMKKPFLR
ncbi:MAG: hypothetical protein LBH53_01110 [Puniceicoccales bacterium]|nr:hypothetical protein [Puniceicoccales bacterium]